MKPADGKIAFGSWHPDLPDLDNPGLTLAENVIPVDGGYRPFNPLGTDIHAALNATCLGAFSIATPPSGQALYAGDGTKLYLNGNDKSGASVFGTLGFWRFAEYRGIVVATNFANAPQRHTFGSVGNFTNLASTGTAPVSVHVGTIGQFVVLGSLSGARQRIQWCAIDDPTDWPTPGTADAVAKQAGAQDFDAEFGNVTSIVGGDQHGLILQNSGITRMTYIGGTDVFQFDQFEFDQGAYFENATVQVGNTTYFISVDGFHKTDGVSVVPIGRGVIDRFFFSNINNLFPNKVYGAAFPRHRCIFWGFPNNASTRIILIYHYELDRWSYGIQNHEVLVSSKSQTGLSDILYGSPALAFFTDHIPYAFDATPGTAKITTGEIEFYSGARAEVQGVKPHVTYAAGTASVGVEVGTRENQDDSVTYTTSSTPHARTGFAGFRANSRYHRARVTLTGNFDVASGLEYQQVYAGAA